jgi:ribosomal protein S25
VSAPEKAPETPAKAETPLKAEAPAKVEAPAKAEEPAKKAPAKEAPKAPAKAEEAPAAVPEAPKDRKSLDAMVKKYGADQAVKALSKVKVVDLRSLAREYNGEFGIAGREIRNANKKVLIEEFSKLFSK